MPGTLHELPQLLPVGAYAAGGWCFNIAMVKIARYERYQQRLRQRSTNPWGGRGCGMVVISLYTFALSLPLRTRSTAAVTVVAAVIE